MEDTKIYIICHKKVDYEIPSNDIYTPLQTGKQFNGNISLYDLSDDQGINISYLNDMMYDLTAIWWIWKNDKSKYVGQCTYRRQLIIDDVQTILHDYDIIVSQPLLCGNVYKQYQLSGNIKDLDLLKKLIIKYYPNYVIPYENIIENGSILFYSNGFITTKENHNKICSFVFDVLFKFIEEYGYKTINDYRNKNLKEYVDWIINHPDKDINYLDHFLGFLSERLFTLYFLTNFRKIYTIEYTLKENTEI